MVYHVPKIMKINKILKIRSGQEVEKLNDDIKMIDHRKSDKHDPSTEATKLVFRRRLLAQQCLRIKRKYQKHNVKFWKFWTQGGKTKVFLKVKAKRINRMRKYVVIYM